MKIFISSLIIMLCSSQLFAFDGCGVYVSKGIVVLDKKDEKRLKYISAPDTKSQRTFYFTEKDTFKVLSFANKEVTLKGKILKPMDGTKGLISEVIEIKGRLPDPLSADEYRFEKISSLKCEK